MQHFAVIPWDRIGLALAILALLGLVAYLAGRSLLNLARDLDDEDRYAE